MTSTQERIEQDIKKNVKPRLDELLKVEGAFMESVAAEIAELAMEVSGKLTNLSTAGTKAGEAEMNMALELIQQAIAKKLATTLKAQYNF